MKGIHQLLVPKKGLEKSVWVSLFYIILDIIVIEFSTLLLFNFFSPTPLF